MKRILLAVLLLLGMAPMAEAQKGEDPIHWTFEAKPIGNGQYDLYFHAKLDGGWHIFSQNAGDEFLIPPGFTYTGKVATAGKVREVGKLHTVRMEGIDNPVNYYEGSVDFVQTVKATKGGQISGTVEFQICDATHCLAPKKLPFRIQLK